MEHLAKKQNEVLIVLLASLQNARGLKDSMTEIEIQHELA